MTTQSFNPPPTVESSARAWPPAQGDWTFSDYAKLPDNGFRYEVIYGDLYMSPAPFVPHQRAATRIASLIFDHLEANDLGEAFSAPIDVVFPNAADPIQPDVIAIKTENLNIIADEKRVEGAPDLVVEVLSKSTADRDRGVKFKAYADGGVSEYWIVDPHAQTIEVNVLRGHAYVPIGTFAQGQTVRSEAFHDLEISVNRVFRIR